MKKIYCCLILLLSLSCQTTQIGSNQSYINESDYKTQLDKFSDDAQEYDGLQNTLDISATILNSTILTAQTQRQATLLNWDKTQYEKELTSKLNSTQSKTDFFVSFYTPERKNSDLTRSETLWKLILSSNNKRIEGKVSKITLLNSEIQSLYPQHNRWSNAYIVSFPIPLSEVEKSKCELSISGPLAHQVLLFEPIK